MSQAINHFVPQHRDWLLEELNEASLRRTLSAGLHAAPVGLATGGNQNQIGGMMLLGQLEKHLWIPSILMGLGYRLENYYTGSMTVAHFLEEYGK